MLLSVSATVSSVAFVVGGYLADRLPARVPITLGLIATGLAGIYLSTLPPYAHMLVLAGFFAFCADCLCWPALLKAIRATGDESEQGRMFGFFEGGRGLADTLVALLALPGLWIAPRLRTWAQVICLALALGALGWASTGLRAGHFARSALAPALAAE